MSTVLPVLKRDVKLQLTNYRTSTYDVALVRIYNADLKRAACDWLEMQDAKKFVICAPSHNFTGLYLCNIKACTDNRKKTLNSNISSTCPHNMVNFVH